MTDKQDRLAEIKERIGFKKGTPYPAVLDDFTWMIQELELWRINFIELRSHTDKMEAENERLREALERCRIHSRNFIRQHGTNLSMRGRAMSKLEQVEAIAREALEERCHSKTNN